MEGLGSSWKLGEGLVSQWHCGKGWGLVAGRGPLECLTGYVCPSVVQHRPRSHGASQPGTETSNKPEQASLWQVHFSATLSTGVKNLADSPPPLTGLPALSYRGATSRPWCCVPSILPSVIPCDTCHTSHEVPLQSSPRTDQFKPAPY